MEIYCLMVSGLPLTKDMRDCLHEVARMMVRKDLNRLPFRADDFVGCAYTSGEHASLVWIGGIVFTANIESQLMTTRVRYIGRTADLQGLEDAVWEDISSQPQYVPSPN